MSAKIRVWTENLLILLLFMFELLDVLHLVSGDIVYIANILSWIAFGYIMYRVSLTKVINGIADHRTDLVIIFSYFLFMIKDFTAFVDTLEGSVIFQNFIYIIISMRAIIEKYGFYLAGLILLFVSLYMAKHAKVKMPSLMYALHQDRHVHNFWQVIGRFFTILLSLLGFYIIVFNLAAQWWVFVLDAPLILFPILIYLFLIIRHYRQFSAESFIFRAGSFGDRVYESFIELFHDKRTIGLSIAGLLSLQLMTDAGYFIAPYVLNFEPEPSFEKIGPGHTALMPLFNSESTGFSGIYKLALMLVYAFNTIAMLFLLLMPVFVWWKLAREKELHVNNFVLSTIFASLACFIIMPLFRIKTILSDTFIGVDIQTHGALQDNWFSKIMSLDINTALLAAAVISLAIGMLIFILDFSHKIRKDMFVVSVVLGMTFFGYYLYNFFISSYRYFLENINAVFQASEYILVFFLMVFALFTLSFYILGFVVFIYEFFKKHFFEHTIG